jgi:hypothetical protein
MLGMAWEAMRRALILAFGVLILGGGAASAEPYAVLAFSGEHGLSVVDAGSVVRDGSLPRAKAYLILPHRPPQRVYLEESQVEFDCARTRMRVLSTVRYGDQDRALARADKPAAWEKAQGGTPGAAMHRQVCAGTFDPAYLRGQGQDVFAFARAMRPALSQLKD